jgi:GT2 family glycosyltransferase
MTASGLESVSITILTFQRPDMLAENLRGLQALSESGAQVIVVDNSTDQETRDLVAGHFPWVDYVPSDTNAGVAGRNIGIAAARGEIVVTLDDDVTGLSEMHCRTLVKAFQESEQLGAVCFRVVDSVKGETCNWCHHRKIEDAHSRFLTYEISEGAVAFRRVAWSATAGYPEQFFISHEGKDVAFQLMNLGFDVVYDGSICVTHFHHMSGRPSWRRYYFDTRNQFWLAARHMPMGYAVRYLLIGQASMLVYAIRDGHLSAWLRGHFDGLWGMRGHLKDRSAWTPETSRKCREIDKLAPGFFWMVRQRLFRRGVAI